MHLLLTELISNQKQTAAMFTPRDKMIWSLERRSNRLKLFGHTDMTLVLGMTIKFIDSDQMLRQLLLLGKDYYETLKRPVYKQALLRSSQHCLKAKRITLWFKLLDIPRENETLLIEDYIKYKERSQHTENLPKTISDAIEVDVARSFNHLKEVSASNLNNILKSYACVNSEVLDYCQGMNFVAGFLYVIVGRREDLAFALLKAVIARYSMHHLFDSQLPMLKLNFYQLDRLIAILLPDLHTHFKDESINSSYFSAPYFITVFTSILQMQSHMRNCEALLRLWDYFIVVSLMPDLTY
jgi:hypothetical protein